MQSPPNHEIVDYIDRNDDNADPNIPDGFIKVNPDDRSCFKIFHDLSSTEKPDVEKKTDDKNAKPKKKRQSGGSEQNQTEWLSVKASGKSYNRDSVNILTQSSGPVGLAKHANTELDSFSLLVTDEMIDNIVTLTNITRELNRNANDEDDQGPVTNRNEINCLIGLLLLRGLYHDTKQTLDDLWHDSMCNRPIYKACFSLNRYSWLMKNITFHDPRSIEKELLQDTFARMKWWVSEFEDNARTVYRHTSCTVIDETLVNYYAKSGCKFKVYMNDKPGKYGILFCCLVDAKDKYISRVIPYTTPAKNVFPTDNTIQNLVIEICADILRTGRNVTGDRLFTAIDTAEVLYKKKLTYCGEMAIERKGLPDDFKESKGREIHSSVFKWKAGSPVMMVSHIPNKDENISILTTAHDNADISTDPSKDRIPEVMDFYKKQRCGVDIVHNTIKDYSCQLVTNSWTLVIFTFILDLAVVNAQTILQYNSKEHTEQSRVDFIKNLAVQLCLPHLRERRNKGLLPTPVLDAINSILDAQDPTESKPDLMSSRNSSLPNPTPENTEPKKCHLCVRDLDGLPSAEQRKKKGNLQKVKSVCQNCWKSTCEKHINTDNNQVKCLSCLQVKGSQNNTNSTSSSSSNTNSPKISSTTNN